MSKSSVPCLVTAEWLVSHLGDDDLTILDGSWHMPAEGRNPAAEFSQVHIAGSAFFDIDGICDPTSDLPHTFPDVAVFSRAVGELGADSRSHIIVYDVVGLFSAARVWWMLRAFGHHRVSVLSGGLPRWLELGYPTETGRAVVTPATFRANLNPELLCSFNEIRTNLTTGLVQVVDARSAGRFEGVEPEPRPDLAGGHIPASRNVPFPDVLVEDGATLRAPSDIEEVFAYAGVRIDRTIVTSCGSGITACTLALALFSIGVKDVAVYDGSWTEWGGRRDTPIETGKPRRLCTRLQMSPSI